MARTLSWDSRLGPLVHEYTQLSVVRFHGPKSPRLCFFLSASPGILSFPERDGGKCSLQRLELNSVSHGTQKICCLRQDNSYFKIFHEV